MKNSVFHCVTHGHDTYCDLTTNGNVVVAVILLILFFIAVLVLILTTPKGA